jgi:hypothetical protein
LVEDEVVAEEMNMKRNSVLKSSYWENSKNPVFIFLLFQSAKNQFVAAPKKKL